ncbi:hypothetical protein QFC22_004616 [Naganishia vaughanmartiniae]|uniref:Uncharacterized protein n=1 Tax=Naganishia vaughanmartiniae TaxID=1424756 RepID=A0ACC2WZP8_9TREE|nr:hypothetical protein QFC22_004616 [Naganishia vaughanmartiniae]
MVARSAAVSSSRILVRQSIRASRRTANRSVSSFTSRAQCLHTSVPTRLDVANEPAEHAEFIPGATYVHIPPLEIPASGLVPTQGSVKLRVGCVDSLGQSVPTVAHALTIAKAVEAKCGPIVAIHHRRDPRNGTFLKSMEITLLHPITLTKDALTLEIPCHRIPFDHLVAGGPSLEEVERAILDPPTTSSSSIRTSTNTKDKQNTSSKTQNQDQDVFFARVMTISSKESSGLARKYGVSHRALPVEISPGVFGASVRSRHRSNDERRGRRTPEEEKEEDEQIVSRLMDWKGFYGGFEALQGSYQPLRSVVKAQDAGRPSTLEGAEESVDQATPLTKEQLAEQQATDKRILKERLDAERAYWSARREAEKEAKRKEEKESAAKTSPATPSATLLARLISRGNDIPVPTASTSSTSTSQTTTQASRKQQSASTTAVTDSTSLPVLNKAQTRLIEQARERARKESSRWSVPLNILGSSSANQKQSSTTTATGFRHVGSASDGASKSSASKVKPEEKESWLSWASSMFTGKS